MTRKRSKSAHSEMARGAQHTEASGPQIEPRFDPEPNLFLWSSPVRRHGIFRLANSRRRSVPFSG